MAGSQRKTSDKRSTARKPASAKGPGEHAKEAVSEWGKALRYGAAATKPALKGAAGAAARPLENLLESRTEKGGKLGDVADWTLSKMGFLGKAGSKVGVGSRVVERMRSDGDGDSDRQAPEREVAEVESNGAGGGGPIPLQEAIDVAVPVKLAFRLAVEIESYPEWSERIEAVEDFGDDTFALAVKIRGRTRTLEIEIVDALPGERIDWECEAEIEHAGTVTFHRLAPRLTHIELTIDWQPDGLVERLTRSIHLSERALRTELQRFKAYAELYEDEEPEDLEEEPADEEEEEEYDEEPVAEEDLDEDEEDLDEEEYEGEELVDEEDEDFDEEEEGYEEEEPEPARA